MFPLLQRIKVKNRRGAIGLRIISLSKSATISKLPDAYRQASPTEQSENSSWLIISMLPMDLATEEDGHA
jgi:hypothetical protein